MSKKLNITLITLFFCYLSHGQNSCNISTITPHFTFYAGPPTTFTLVSYSVTPILYLCRNATVYDTNGTSVVDRIAIIDQGAQYIWKVSGAAVSGIWVKSGGTLTLYNTQTAGPVNVYIETGAVVNDPFSALNGSPTTCTSIALPSVNCATGLTEQAIDKLITLFPNPTSDNCRLQIDLEINQGQFVVSTPLGKAVRQQTVSTGTNNINLSELSSGLYYYTVLDKGKVVLNSKVVIK